MHVCVRACVRACVRTCVCLSVSLSIPLSVCQSVCPSVCLSLASDSTKTINVIMKLGTMTASDIGMYHVLIIFTLTFIQGHTDLNRESNKCSMISETVQGNAHHVFAVKIIVKTTGL